MGCPGIVKREISFSFFITLILSIVLCLSRSFGYDEY